MPADTIGLEVKSRFRLVKQYVKPGEEFAEPNDPPFEIREFGDDCPTVVTEFDRSGRPIFQQVFWEKCDYESQSTLFRV